MSYSKSSQTRHGAKHRAVNAAAKKLAEAEAGLARSPAVQAALGLYPEVSDEAAKLASFTRQQIEHVGRAVVKAGK